MVSREQLYDAFGELIYAVALADGVIQKEEVTALTEILRGHPWAAEIKWSFNYEKIKGNPLDDTYKKALVTCQDNGPDKEYKFLLEVLETVAHASKGIDDGEKKVMRNFEAELRAQFEKDLMARDLL